MFIIVTFFILLVHDHLIGLLVMIFGAHCHGLLFLLFMVVITLLVSWPWFLVVIVVICFSPFLGHDHFVGFLIVVFHSLALLIFLLFLIMITLLVS
jgi:hypothetical protein